MEGEVTLRYAIISDLHANLQAWNAVLTDIRSMNADEIICLGDVVGYGPKPADVLELAYANVHHFLLGNHDAVLCGKMNPDCFNETAQQIINWTASQISAEGKKFFGKLPYVIDGGRFCCAHADPASPARYAYILEAEAALQVWETVAHQLTFVGHSHVPGLYVVGKSGRAHWLPPTDFAMEAQKRYIVNVGSVGQPRDGDVRADYCLFDTETESILFRQVPFDLDAYREDLAGAGLPESASYFLSKAINNEPVREMLDFHPPSASEVKEQPITVKKLEEAVVSAKRWRRGAIFLFLILLLSVGAAAIVLHKYPSGSIRYNSVSTDLATAPKVDGECLRTPEMIGQVSEDSRLQEWSIELENAEQQQVFTEKHPDLMPEKAVEQVLFRLNSDAPLTLSLLSVPVPAQPGMRFSASASFKKLELQDGYVELCLVQQLSNQVEKLLAHRVVERLSETDHWVHASVTMPRAGKGLDEAGHVRLLVRGQFIGNVLVRNASMILKEHHSRKE